LQKATTRGVVEALRPFGNLIYPEMTRLAIEHDAINLGQGFPYPDGPVELRAFAGQAIIEGPHQYQNPRGMLELRTAIARQTQTLHGVAVSPEREVLVTMGAQEALLACLLGLVEAGDEVIVFDPVYASYLPMLALARATPKRVSLRGREFRLDTKELESAFSSKTRAVLVNSPMNPTGRIFSKAELEQIAELCERFDAILIGDEVYEHHVYDGRRPDTVLNYAQGRALAVSSMSKTYSYTGWRVGWVQGPAELVDAANLAHQNMSFSVAAGLQRAATHALRSHARFYADLRTSFQGRRDLLCQGLADLKLDPIVPAGSFFCLVDARRLGFDDDVKACLELPASAGVAGAPISIFWESEQHRQPLVRLCFAKEEAMLREALDRLASFLGK
jgi:N-succinyldiaminopimelate aminotransferase